MEVNGNALERKLASIEREKQAWIQKGVESSRAEILAEQQKTQAIEELEKSFSEKILEVNGNALEKKLAAIEREKQAWIQKGVESSRAEILAEQQKAQAIEELEKSFNKRLLEASGDTLEQRLAQIEQEKQAWIDKGIAEVRASQLAQKLIAKVYEEQAKKIRDSIKGIYAEIEQERTAYLEKESEKRIALYEQEQALLIESVSGNDIFSIVKNSQEKITAVYNEQLQRRIAAINQEISKRMEGASSGEIVALTREREAKIAAVQREFADKREQIIRDSFNRTKNFLREAYNIQLSLTQNAYQQEIQSINQWKEAQFEKARTAEEVSAIIADAAAKEAEAFSREVDRIKGKIESAQDRLMRLTSSQKDYDIYKAKQQYQQDINDDIPQGIAAAIYDATIKEINQRAKEDTSGSYSKPKSGNGLTGIDAYEKAIEIAAEKYGTAADIVTAARKKEIDAINAQADALKKQYQAALQNSTEKTQKAIEDTKKNPIAKPPAQPKRRRRPADEDTDNFSEYEIVGWGSKKKSATAATGYEVVDWKSKKGTAAKNPYEVVGWGGGKSFIDFTKNKSPQQAAGTQEQSAKFDSVHSLLENVSTQHDQIFQEIVADKSLLQNISDHFNNQTQEQNYSTYFEEIINSLSEIGSQAANIAEQFQNIADFSYEPETEKLPAIENPAENFSSEIPTEKIDISPITENLNILNDAANQQVLTLAQILPYAENIDATGSSILQFLQQRAATETPAPQSNIPAQISNPFSITQPLPDLTEITTLTSQIHQQLILSTQQLSAAIQTENQKTQTIQPVINNSITVQVENVNASREEEVAIAADLIAEKITAAVNSMGNNTNLSYAS